MRRPEGRLSPARAGRNVAAAFVAATLVACGGSSGGAAGAQAIQHVTSDSGAFAIDVATDSGAAPVRGVNTLVLTIHDAAGAPATGLSLTIVPWMPAMGHGASVTPTIVDGGGGTYVASDVDLFMPGMWELRTTIAAPSGTTDHADPQFQIE